LRLKSTPYIMRTRVDAQDYFEDRIYISSAERICDGHYYAAAFKRIE